MKKIIITIVFLTFTILTFGQQPVTEISFTAINNTDYMQLDSIKVMNRTQGTDTLLYWPDTLLVLNEQTGIYDDTQRERRFQIFQNFPNPVYDQTSIIVHIPSRNTVSFKVTDVNGRLVLQKEMPLDEGFHSFLFMPGSGNYSIFTARWQNESKSIKILHPALASAQSGMLEYHGRTNTENRLKSVNEVKTFGFEAGDQLLYIGYFNNGESGILDSPAENKTVIFQFATNIPCPGIPTVTYEGQTYNTIQIFSQCWLKENLNVGEMIIGFEEMTDNGIIEKYCQWNDPAYCDLYGGLYFWDEAMQYSAAEGAQGICPDGWHIPIWDEWKILFGMVDSQYGIGSPHWEGGLGYDVGLNLKSETNWNGADLYGFNALPGGNFHFGFGDIGSYGDWWSSTTYGNKSTWAYALELGGGTNSIYGIGAFKGWGYSVRCIKSE